MPRTHATNPVARRFAACAALAWIPWLAGGAAEPAAPRDGGGWEAVGVSPQEGACPELFTRLWPSGFDLECAPYDGDRPRARAALDRWLEARGDRTEARDAWVRYKVGRARVEPIAGPRWSAWWLPKNEPFVVRVTRDLGLAACREGFRARGWDAPASDVEDEPLRDGYTSSGNRGPVYPVEARIRRASGFTVHLVRVDVDGRVVGWCPLIEAPRDMAFAEASEGSFEGLVFSPRDDADARVALPAERIVSRAYTIDAGAITSLRWKSFLKPEKYGVRRSR